MRTVLAIGSHPDDIELGCFGTLAKYKNDGNEVHLLVLSRGEGAVFGHDREEETKKSVSLINANLYLENLPDRYISEGVETISVIERYVERIKPDIVFLPSGNDTHQDHRATFNAGLVACRLIKEIYAYETPSTSRNFFPNYFVDISDFIDLKVEAVKIHSSQKGKGYMAYKAVKGLAQYRAFDIYLSERYVEGFEVIKVLV